MNSFLILPVGSFPLPLDRLPIFPEPDARRKFPDYPHAQLAQWLPCGIQFFVRSFRFVAVHHGQQRSTGRTPRSWKIEPTNAGKISKCPV